MNKKFSLMGFLIIVLLLIFSPAGLKAQGIRKAVWAGQFYEADPVRLSRLLEVYLEAAQVEPVSGEVVGIIVPHAGYVYAGQVAAKGYRLVKGQKIDSVVIIGPSHQYGFNGCSIYLKGGFETPLGVAEVDEDLARDLAKQSGFGYIPEAQAKEHSIEVQVPFIQKTFPGAKIVPVVMGFQTEKTVRTLSEALSRVLPGRKALVVASTDMSHFLPRKEANQQDSQTIELIRSFDLQTLVRKVERGENLMCGGGPVLSLLIYAQKLGQAKVSVLAYSDSVASGGPDDRVVGYLSAAVYLDQQPGLLNLSPEEKRALLSLARKAIEFYLETGQLLAYEPVNPKFKEPTGAFVTLKENQELRGCIGFAEPVLPLAQTIIQAAVYAASQDPRFPPLRKSELSKIEIEISVLGPLQPVSNISEIKVGQHGLIIKRAGRSGLLLPQVATEYHWDRETFLQELCRKAGLPDNVWKSSEARLLKFEAVVFNE
ncbi:MAG: AmmeMemoRadiSam system protein B [Candidatus Saccharicenans sp.]